ncbi:MAG: TPR repeat protein, partial [Lysobacterales bacterium]
MKYAKKGNQNAQFDAAFGFSSGIGVDENPVQAGYWYEKAAEQGHHSAMFTIGTAYCRGHKGAWTGVDVPQDIEKGEAYLTKAFVEGGIHAVDHAPADSGGPDRRSLIQLINPPRSRNCTCRG